MARRRRFHSEIRQMAYKAVPHMEFATDREKEAIADGFVDGYQQVDPKHQPHDGTRLVGSPLDRRLREKQSK